MTLREFVSDNYQTLPKSKFDDDELVIVKEYRNEDHGWGHHLYEGLGIDEFGLLFWCYSSGCSCEGSCNTDHIKDLKKFVLPDNDPEFVDSEYIPDSINFNALEVEFHSY